MVALLMDLACCCYGESVIIYCLNFTRDLFLADCNDSSVMKYGSRTLVDMVGAGSTMAGCRHAAGGTPPQATPFLFARFLPRTIFPGDVAGLWAVPLPLLPSCDGVDFVKYFL